MLSAYVSFYNPSINLGNTFLCVMNKNWKSLTKKKKILKIFAHNTFMVFMVVIK